MGLSFCIVGVKIHREMGLAIIALMGQRDTYMHAHTRLRLRSITGVCESFPSALDDRRGLATEVQQVALKQDRDEKVPVVLFAHS